MSNRDHLQIVDLEFQLAQEKIAEQKVGFDGGGGPPYDGHMDARVAKLEKFADESRSELRTIDVRLAKIETLISGIDRTVATKTDIADIRTALSNIENIVRNSATNVDLQSVKTLISEAETRTLRWFLGIVLTVAGLRFAAAKVFGP